MIHLVGLPHTEFNRERYSSCAFTAKTVNLTRMLACVGRECTVYWGGDASTCAEDVSFVSVMSSDEQRELWPDYDGTQLPPLTWLPGDAHWRTFNGRCIDAIAKVIRPGDIVAVVGGAISQSVVDAFGDNTCIEPGAGYEGLCRGTWVCFESYAWMHHRYGWRGIDDGRLFDAVIPNAVDDSLFDVAEPKDPPYALFMGRMIVRKGPHVAVEIAGRAGIELFVAGSGLEPGPDGQLRTGEGQVVAVDADHHLGHLDIAARRAWLARAAVFICPTVYVEPWGGVHAEALMSGVPVVAPDYGVFTETLDRHYRYRTLAGAAEAVGWALKHNSAFDRSMRREAAVKSFGFARCAALYDDWFDRLDSLRDGRNGWYA